VILDLLELDRLPLQEFVGEALEGLAEHDPPAGLGVAGAEVQVGQPALPAPMSPLDGEHYQVERVARLHLDPPRATAPGRVRRGERFHHDSLVTVGEGIGEELGRLVQVCGHEPRHNHFFRNDTGQCRMSLLVGQVEQVPAVEMQHVEEEHGQRHRGARLACRPCGGVLKRIGAPVGPQGDQFPVEHGIAYREPRQFLDHLGQPGRDVIERPGEQPYAAAGYVRLDADAVELPFHGRSTADLGHGILNRRRTRGQHGLDRPSHLETELGQRLFPAAKGRGRRRGQRPAEHRRPAHVSHGNIGGARDGLGHHPVECPLPQLTRQQPDEKILLIGGRGPHEIADHLPAGSGRPFPAHRPNPRKRLIHITNREGGVVSRRRRIPQRGPPHPNLPLRQFPRQISDHDGRLFRRRQTQRGRQRLNLGKPCTSTGDVPRHVRGFSQQHETPFAWLAARD
jgi:hypothetical protein